MFQVIPIHISYKGQIKEYLSVQLDQGVLLLLYSYKFFNVLQTSMGMAALISDVFILLIKLAVLMGLFHNVYNKQLK